jgi:hypothetical protein
MPAPAETVAAAFVIVDGFIISRRTYLLRDEGRVNTNHKHPDPHLTTFGSQFLMRQNGGEWEMVGKGDVRLIPAHTLHQFKALEPMATYTCDLVLRDANGDRVPEGHGYTDADLQNFTRWLVYHDQPEIHHSVAKD